MTREENFAVKIERLREAMEKNALYGVEIESQANFSYFTRGRGFIGLASVAACGSLIITQDRVCLVAENIEAGRLYAEQTKANPAIELFEYPWDNLGKKEAIVKEIMQGKPLATEKDMAQELFQLRTSLTPYDVEDYRQLCFDTAEKLEEICCEKLCVGMSEYELAGIIANAFWAINIEPITILVAFDDRARKYRHPVPNGARLENYALVSVCGRRNGLVSSVTRNVLLQPDHEFIEKNKQCADVMACILENLMPGTSLKQIFGEISRSYRALGYEGEEKYHHQGGLTGYIPREIKADAGTAHCVKSQEAYAFNPTIQGGKCEDTVLVTDHGVEIMSYTGNYTYNTYHIQGKDIYLPAVYVVNR